MTPTPKALAKCRCLQSSIEAIQAIVADRKADWEAIDGDVEEAAKSLGFDIVTAKAVFRVFIDGSGNLGSPTPSTKPKAKGSANDDKG